MPDVEYGWYFESFQGESFNVYVEKKCGENFCCRPFGLYCEIGVPSCRYASPLSPIVPIRDPSTEHIAPVNATSLNFPTMNVFERVLQKRKLHFLRAAAFTLDIRTKADQMSKVDIDIMARANKGDSAEKGGAGKDGEERVHR